MDYSNPTLDFDLETATLIKALKQAEGMRDARMTPQATIVGGRAMFGGGPGQTLASGVDNISGMIRAPQIEQQQRDLSAEQQRRFADLQQHLVAPVPETRTVLKQALRQGEGPLLQPNVDQVETQVPLTEEERAMAQHAQRMSVGSKMLGLPMARGMGEKLIAKGVDFPEQMQQLKMKQIEAGNLAAQRAQDKARSDADRNLLLMAIAGGKQDIAQAGLDMKREGVEEKQDATRQKAIDAESGYLKAAGHLEGIINELQGTPNLNAATGAIGGRSPFFFSLTPNDKSTAQSRIKNLQEFLQTKGLEDLRRAGVAPGSVTEREWAKFAARAGNIDPNLDDASFNKEVAKLLVDVKQSMTDAQSRLEALPKPGVRGQSGGVAPTGAPAGGQGNMVHDPVSNKTYVKDANGRWWMQ